jgi:phenylacetyl-CoA:acceptor oxidoreductase subunit 1
MPTEKQYGMVIDLRRCLGCGACEAACSQANGTPEKLWRQVKDLGILPHSDGLRLTIPISCMHCEQPPCQSVCPTGATNRKDGIVSVDPHRCIGCGYCILACPYRARAIYRSEMDFDRAPARARGPETGERAGTCTKCDFCRMRVCDGEKAGLVPGEDAAATPACVVNCSAQAIVFGDLNDPQSKISRLIATHHTVRLAEEKGTRPHIYYIVDCCESFTQGIDHAIASQ